MLDSIDHMALNYFEITFFGMKALKTYAAFPMRTFPASANRESCLGPVFRPLMDSNQHSFRYSSVISVFRHFLHKITN